MAIGFEAVNIRLLNVLSFRPNLFSLNLFSTMFSSDHLIGETLRTVAAFHTQPGEQAQQFFW